MRSLGSLSPSGSIALGIVVGVISTSVQSLGLTLQRKSHILEDEKAPHVARRPPHRRRRWQLGMAMFLVANLLGSSVQISTLPLPVLSTLQASGLVFNSICATLILGEPFTRWSLWGTLLVCSGAVLIAVFGAIPAPAHNLRELLALLVRPPFVAWMSLQAVIVVALAVAVELASALLFVSQGSLSTSLPSSSSSPPPPSSSPSSPSSSSRFRLARGLVYGCISGILSAHSLLVAKSAVELVVRTIADGNNQFRHWQAWALVLVFLTLALTQLYYLHRGLKLVSTSVLYPLVFCVYNIIAILDGLIYFRQTDMIGPLRACLISLGTAILLSGVFALSWRLSDEQHPAAVSQQTLAPGFALVDNSNDACGEGEEEEALLLRSDVLIEDASDEERETGLVSRPRAGTADEQVNGERRSLLPHKFVSSYHTFSFGTGVGGDAATAAALADGVAIDHPPASPTSIRRKAAASLSFSAAAQPTTPTRWTERAEIWGELEDHNSGSSNSHATKNKHADGGRRRRSSTGLLLGSHRRHRSSTLPSSPLAGPRAARRGVSISIGSPAEAPQPSRADGEDDTDDTDATAVYRKDFHHRLFPAAGRKGSTTTPAGDGDGDGNSSSSSSSDNGPAESRRGMWKLATWWRGDKGKQQQQRRQAGEGEPPS